MLSFISVGSAAAARVVVGELALALFITSVVFLAYAHWRVWVRKQGHRNARVILVVNTFLVALLWFWRLPF
ncbi:hypothetical protein MYX65_09470 [Acidobacteria bacterium AH-259-L09]|nr:hypothetical protein [Acidobacteria bacterium AH-259-L09]